MAERIVYVLAGEPSGDVLGARLIAALKKQSSRPIVFRGIGGPRMIAEGLEPLFDQTDLAVFGLAEFLPKIPKLFMRLRQTIAAIRRDKPAALVTIDAPDFSFRVARALKGEGIPLIHYVAPSVWAWRPGRAKKVAKFLDHLLTLFAFEPPYFADHGLATTFVGHAAIENGIEKGNAARLRAKLNIADDAVPLVVLPGSRAGEISRLMPVYGEAIGMLMVRQPKLVPLLPVVPHLKEMVSAQAANWPMQPILIEGDDDKYDAFALGRAALAASGTVTLELALANLPMVVAYKLHPLTVRLYKHLLLTKHFSLVNILAGEPVVPELMQDDCTAEACAKAVGTLLDDPASASGQRVAFRKIREQIENERGAPSDLAARVVMSYVDDATS